VYILWVIVSNLSEFEDYDELEIQVDQRRIVVRCDLTSWTLGGTGLGPTRIEESKVCNRRSRNRKKSTSTPTTPTGNDSQYDYWQGIHQQIEMEMNSTPEGRWEINTMVLSPKKIHHLKCSKVGLLSLMCFSGPQVWFFLKCCPDTINYCLHSCWLKTSTPQMPKYVEHARQRTRKQVQERDKPNCEKTLKCPTKPINL